MRYALFASLTLASLAVGCHSAATNPQPAPSNELGHALHSSSLALDATGKELYVVNPESDSISVLDVQTRQLEREILLAAAPPSADASTGRYTPSIMPRTVALSPDGATLYVTAERASAVLAVDVASGTIRGSVPVGSEPVGSLLSADGRTLFVACSQDGKVVRLDTQSLAAVDSVTVPSEPWALAASADGHALFVSQFLGPGVVAVDPTTMTVTGSWAIPDTAPRGDQQLAHGQVRGLYDLAQRPGTSELWVAHTLLGTDTPQPALDFKSTAFPALSLLYTDGTFEQTLSNDASAVPGIDGSFGDVVSGPHALAFTSDGAFALMVDANSEDVLVVDTRQHSESALVRPLPGKMPDGIVIAPDQTFAYVDERISGDVAVLKLERTGDALHVSVDGAAITRQGSDPMPETLRLGQQLFNSANSSVFPITTDHWVACATCHMEGRSDAVVWLFAQGPRDTPSNAGGMLETGFLFRTADRNKVQDYWHTINVEQGGHFDPSAQSSLLDALTAYVNLALPLPIPPTTDPTLVARGASVFTASGCGTCHAGPRFTDSGSGNPTLDLTGTVVLHDVGTCVTSGAFPDVAHEDLAGDPRDACAFDTPSLNGVASSPPYFHDDSAATLRDAVLRMPTPPTADDDIDALVEYLRSL
ncbi:MAG TPA: hypothetical protein VGI10_00620 [Polyangiaceae bacterium]